MWGGTQPVQRPRGAKEEGTWPVWGRRGPAASRGRAAGRAGAPRGGLVRRPRWKFGRGGLGSQGRVPSKGWEEEGEGGGEARARDPAAPGPPPRPLAPRPRRRPSSPRPGPSRRPPAHRGSSGLRPPRAPSAAPLQRRCRRHLPPAAVTQRRRCTSRAAGKWSPPPRPVPAPTACRVGSRPPSPGVHRGGRHFRPSSAMPFGKCSPRRAGAGRKRERRLLGNGVRAGRRPHLPRRQVDVRLQAAVSGAPGSGRRSGCFNGVRAEAPSLSALGPDAVHSLQHLRSWKASVSPSTQREGGFTDLCALLTGTGGVPTASFPSRRTCGPGSGVSPHPLRWR